MDSPGFGFLTLVELSCKGELLSAGVKFSRINLDVVVGKAGLGEALGLAAFVWVMSLLRLAVAPVEEALE